MKGTTKTTDRQVRAYQEAALYLVLPHSPEANDWQVVKTDGTFYVVDADATTCTCPDHVNRATICKHIHLVRFHLEADAPESEAKRPSIQDEIALGLQDEDRYARARRDRDLLWG